MNKKYVVTYLTKADKIEPADFDFFKYALKKHKRKKFRLKCFYALNYIMATVFVLSVCFLNGDGWVAEILCALSLIYGLFANYICELAKAEKGEI